MCSCGLLTFWFLKHLTNNSAQDLDMTSNNTHQATTSTTCLHHSKPNNHKSIYLQYWKAQHIIISIINTVYPADSGAWVTCLSGANFRDQPLSLWAKLKCKSLYTLITKWRLGHLVYTNKCIDFIIRFTCKPEHITNKKIRMRITCMANLFGILWAAFVTSSQLLYLTDCLASLWIFSKVHCQMSCIFFFYNYFSIDFTWYFVLLFCRRTPTLYSHGYIVK